MKYSKANSREICYKYPKKTNVQAQYIGQRQLKSHLRRKEDEVEHLIPTYDLGCKVMKQQDLEQQLVESMEESYKLQDTEQ
jgi:hypothetical protein